MITRTKKVPEMVSVTISGKKMKELEQAIRLVLCKENRKRKAEGKKRLPYFSPPLPARDIEFVQEYDPSYIKTLFGD